MTGAPETDLPNDFYRQYEMLADAADRLTAFRGDQAARLEVLGYPLFLEDLDEVLGFLTQTINTDRKGGSGGADHDKPANDATPLFNPAQSLSDADLAGEHSAMQDGVDDVRKDALIREMGRREV